MDYQWFRTKIRGANVTAAEIADRMGRDRSVVSKILNGHQQMSLDWAQAFADVLQVDLDEVLRRAGALSPQKSLPLAPGFSDSDAVPWRGPEREAAQIDDAKRFFGSDRAGVDAWTVRTAAMSLQGVMPGDTVLVDTHQAENCRAGDLVVAQRYDHAQGTAITLLRRFEPPALVAASLDPGDQRINIVDGGNVLIRGKVVASWRDYRR